VKKPETTEAIAENAPSPPASRSQPPELALLAVEAALDKKALEPVLLDLSGQSSYTDYILVVSGRSDRQVQNIAEGILQAFAQKARRKPLGTEGLSDGRWVLLDFGEVVVHVFYHPMREFYDLEGLWCDASRVQLDVPDDARIGAGTLY
jgi:ribosome-associated protein